jgi:hypothetical protein
MHGRFGRSGLDGTCHDNDVGAYLVHADRNHRSGNNRHGSDGSAEHLTFVDDCTAADSCIRTRTRRLSSPERVPAT